MEDRSCWNYLLLLLLFNLVIAAVRDKAFFSDLFQNFSASTNPIKRVKGVGWIGAFAGPLLILVGGSNLFSLFGGAIFLLGFGIIGFCDLRLGRVQSRWFTLLGIIIFLLAGFSLFLWGVIISAHGE